VLAAPRRLKKRERGKRRTSSRLFVSPREVPFFRAGVLKTKKARRCMAGFCCKMSEAYASARLRQCLHIYCWINTDGQHIPAAVQRTELA
jgi:hypothetical protein